MFKKLVAATTAAVLTAAGLVVGISAPAVAATDGVNPLTATNGFTVLTKGDVNLRNGSSGGEIEGSVAAGGNVSFGTYNLAGNKDGSALPTVDGTASVQLFVGGTVQIDSGSSKLDLKGRALISDTTGMRIQGGDKRLTRGNVNRYVLTPSALGQDTIPEYTASAGAFQTAFPATTFSDAAARAAYYKTLTAADPGVVVVPTGVVDGGKLRITLQANKINVWNITRTQLSYSEINFAHGVVPSASTPLIINVVPDSPTDDGTTFAPPKFTGNPDDSYFARHVLWSFTGFSTVKLTGSEPMGGAIFAPEADVIYDRDNPLRGQILAASLKIKASGEIHNYGFEATLPIGRVATAEAVYTPPTCEKDGFLALQPTTTATWSAYTPALGAYSVVATANSGYTFADGGTTKTFTGTVEAKNPLGEGCKYEVALYLYQKLDPTKPASWQNSGQQTLIATKKGTDWFTEFPAALPPKVCGETWAVQQDKVSNWPDSKSNPDGTFKWPSTIKYPNDNIGWPPIYQAKHNDLSTYLEVPDCVTPTGEPTFTVKSCEVNSQNSISLPEVPGALWQIKRGDQVIIEQTSYSGIPDGYDEYTIVLLDANPDDGYQVATKTWKYTPVDPGTLKCAVAQDPTWIDQVCDPSAPGSTTATYQIFAATGVRYEVYVNDVLVDDDADPGTYNVTAFPTKVTVKAFARDGYTLVGTAENSYVFESAGPCIDKDASATIVTTPATCDAPGGIDLSRTTLVNATWQSALPTAPGSYTVIAVADPGHAFGDGQSTLAIEVTIPPRLSGGVCGELPEFGLATPTLTITQPTCTANGSYTLGEIENQPLRWTVNGTGNIANGTYPAPVEGGTLTFVAANADPTGGLQDWTNPQERTFIPKPSGALCTDTQLTTLALTGVGGGLVVGLLAALVVLVGAGIVLVRRRLVSE